MAFAGYQAATTQAFIDAFAVPSRFRRPLNLVVGILIASAFTMVGGLWLGSWAIVPAGVLACILAAVEAGKEHDAGAVGAASAPPPPRRVEVPEGLEAHGDMHKPGQ